MKRIRNVLRVFAAGTVGFAYYEAVLMFPGDPLGYLGGSAFLVGAVVCGLALHDAFAIGPRTLEVVALLLAYQCLRIGVPGKWLLVAAHVDAERFQYATRTLTFMLDVIDVVAGVLAYRALCLVPWPKKEQLKMPHFPIDHAIFVPPSKRPRPRA